MADVVQQRCCHQLVVGALGNGERGGLDRVVGLGQDLVVVLRTPPQVEVEHLVDRRRRAGHVTGRPWKSPISDTPVCSPSALRRANAASFSR